MKCEKCQKLYSAENCFYKTCGTKLISEKTKIYANFGKKGLTSFTYKLPNGTTFNSKGNLTVRLTNGISYSQKMKEK